ncbi:MAG: 3'(2'),5'-bisphosphate nucleotidase CysQ [Hyphomonadaceae bacterium]
MTPTDDLALITHAARACGPLLRARFGGPVEAWRKGNDSPVTEIDLALDAMLTETLRNARADYGWLSEETADKPDRLACARAFIVDPLDGTRAFLEGKPEFCVSIAVVAGGEAIAGAIYNPITEEMFEGGPGLGARLNGAAVTVTRAAALPDSRLIATKRLFPEPPGEGPHLEMRNALAYRLALVAAGLFDGMSSLGMKHEWDVAAGAAIVAAAGGAVSDGFGGAPRFNQPDPRMPGVVAAGPALHPLIIKRTREMPDPRQRQPQPAAQNKPS